MFAATPLGPSILVYLRIDYFVIIQPFRVDNTFFQKILTELTMPDT